MARIIGAFATSHATTFMNPDRWDEIRADIRSRYVKKYGSTPDEPAILLQETLAGNRERHAAIVEVHDLTRRKLAELSPDALILLGNDQNENFDALGAPQFAVYTGDEFNAYDVFSGRSESFEGHSELAEAVLAHCVNDDFDVVRAAAFADSTLSAHAHSQVLIELVSAAKIPVIPIFINAITPPLTSAQRCFDFGGALRRAIESSLPNMRVVIGVSGGLSHFTFGFPYQSLTEPREFGMICHEFDEGLLDLIRSGRLGQIRRVDNQELLNNGDVEFRQSLAFFGALPEGSRPQKLSYEPFYRAMMGMWAGYWSLDE